MDFSESELKISDQILREEITNAWKETGVSIFIEMFDYYTVNYDKDRIESQLIQMVKLVREKFLPIVMTANWRKEKMPIIDCEGDVIGLIEKLPTREDVSSLRELLSSIVIESFQKVFPQFTQINPSEIVISYKESINVRLVYGVHECTINHVLKLAHQ